MTGRQKAAAAGNRGYLLSIPRSGPEVPRSGPEVPRSGPREVPRTGASTARRRLDGSMLPRSLDELDAASICGFQPHHEDQRYPYDENGG